ncbi:SRPBCC family protein [Sulfitobacter sp. S190]|uniref:SRPBCC family protein n=1 Tax=Sulfitobacter sp. S190 TaxID=2867022 RepID=UPI0021A688EE|nr:SRPBCC family protein [Sulfitobacter sp. S190]UWR21215.1 SRPBCC family protein [Sulfitobacter sp. S190]
MTLLRETGQIMARPDVVWSVLARYGSVDAFSPHVAQSFIIEGTPDAGLGAARQCNLADGKNHVKERVTAWTDGSSYSVEIYEGTMPIRDAYSTVSVEETAPGRTRATIEIGYEPKFGPLGNLMDLILIKPRLSKVAGDNLEGLRAFVMGQGDAGKGSS